MKVQELILGCRLILNLPVAGSVAMSIPLKPRNRADEEQHCHQEQANRQHYL
jgi:hypothetical protein